MSQTTPESPEHGQRHAEIRRQARSHFDRWALAYDRSRLNELIFFPTIRMCLEEIARWQSVRGRGPFRMLDVGCGTGTLLTFVARRPEAELLVGLDYSPVMLRHLREKISPSAGDVERGHSERSEESTPMRGQMLRSAQHDEHEAPPSAMPIGRKLHCVQADAERLPFPDETFDVVTCCNSFHHYPHQAAAVASFRRVLRPGGVLILVDGFRDNVIGWIVFDVGVATVEGNVHHASWSEVRDMIHAAGFSTLRQRKMNVLAPVLVNVALR